jgi:tripartite-type tricarboxylate transporter receptor subunit TctC
VTAVLAERCRMPRRGSARAFSMTMPPAGGLLCMQMTGVSIVLIQRRTALGAGFAVPLAMAGAITAVRSRAQAQAWPSKPIRFIVPFAAGGNADITARLLGEGLQRRFGQSVVVDNRPGAGGVVGQELVLQAPADGYTLVIGTFGTLYVSPLMAGKSSMVADFTPVSLLSTVPMIVDVPANSRFTTWAQLLAAAKASPGTISVGHAGNGTPNHTDILRLQENEKVAFNIVPCRGSGVGLNDVLAGQIDAYIDQLSSSLPHLQSGKLRALVVAATSGCPSRRMCRAWPRSALRPSTAARPSACTSAPARLARSSR